MLFWGAESMRGGWYLSNSCTGTLSAPRRLRTPGQNSRFASFFNTIHDALAQMPIGNAVATVDAHSRV